MVHIRISDLDTIREEISLWNPSHILSIIDVGSQLNLDFSSQAFHHKQFFDDLEQTPTKLILPHIQEILKFRKT